MIQKVFLPLVVGLTLIGASFVFVPSPVHAVDVTKEKQYFIPDIILPGQFERVEIDSSLMSKYFRALYVYMVYIVSIIAVVMIIYGGLKWVAAAGNSAQINDAKDVITNAVIAIVIGLTSYVLLYVINPKLLNLSLPLGDTVTQHALGTLWNEQLGCFEQLSCPPGSTQVLGATCGSNYTTVNPGENACTAAAAGGKGICCQAGDKCYRYSAYDGSLTSKLPYTCSAVDSGDESKRPYCKDATPCGTTTKDCSGLTCGGGNSCLLMFVKEPDGYKNRSKCVTSNGLVTENALSCASALSGVDTKFTIQTDANRNCGWAAKGERYLHAGTDPRTCSADQVCVIIPPNIYTSAEGKDMCVYRQTDAQGLVYDPMPSKCITIR